MRDYITHAFSFSEWLSNHPWIFLLFSIIIPAQHILPCYQSECCGMILNMSRVVRLFSLILHLLHFTFTTLTLSFLMIKTNIVRLTLTYQNYPWNSTFLSVIFISDKLSALDLEVARSKWSPLPMSFAWASRYSPFCAHGILNYFLINQSITPKLPHPCIYFIYSQFMLKN